jgi:hypothetical protein
MRRSRIRDPTWQSIASVVDPLFRLAMLFIPAGPIPPRLTSLAAAWIPCIKQFWLHRKMRVSEANAAIGASREQSSRNPRVIRASALQARAAPARLQDEQPRHQPGRQAGLARTRRADAGKAPIGTCTTCRTRCCVRAGWRTPITSSSAAS